MSDVPYERFEKALNRLGFKLMTSPGRGVLFYEHSDGAQVVLPSVYERASDVVLPQHIALARRTVVEWGVENASLFDTFIASPPPPDAEKVLDLLRQVWNSPEKVQSPTWQTAVLELIGPSACTERLFPGDEVELLVDGFRGKFRGETGIVTNARGDHVGIRIPGKRVPGETEDYCGPYTRSQVRFLRRPSWPASTQ
jgi:predicted RNA binding protein YcfA (HicA-like mRNA interferase family)